MFTHFPLLPHLLVFLWHSSTSTRQHVNLSVQSHKVKGKVHLWITKQLSSELVWWYPGFQRIFFLIDNEAALKQKKAARRKKSYFFLLGALRLVNAASPRTISVHKKKISSGTQGSVVVKQDLNRPEYCDGDRSVVSVFSMVLSVIRNGWYCL